MAPTFASVLRKGIVTALLVLGAAGIDGCDRLEAQQARRAIDAQVLPLLGRRDLLPEACPLRKEYDALLDQEIKKERIGSGHWKCGLCGKRFRNEWYLDKHLELKHNDSSDHGSRRCYADFCGVLVSCGQLPGAAMRDGIVEERPPGEPEWCRSPESITERKQLCRATLQKCVMSPAKISRLGEQICSSAPHRQCADYRWWHRSSPSGDTTIGTESIQLAFGLILVFGVGISALILRLTGGSAHTAPDLRAPLKVRMHRWIRMGQPRQD